MSLLQAILGCGYSDVEFLEDKIEEFDLDEFDVVEYTKEIGELDCNSLIYSTFYLGWSKFEGIARDYLATKGLNTAILDDFDVDIFTNYLDSFFNNPELEDIEITDYSDENIEEFLKRVGYNLENE